MEYGRGVGLFRYYCLVFKYVFSGLWGTVDSIAGVVGILGAFVVSQAPKMGSVVNDLVWQIPLGAFLCLTVLRIILAPYRLHQQLQAGRDNLKSETENLKEQMRPKLKILFEAGKEPFEHTEPANVLGLAKRYFRLAILNDGNTALMHCKLEYFEMEGNVNLPKTMRLKNDDPPWTQQIVTINDVKFPQTISPQYKQSVVLKPDEREFYNFAFLDETGPKSEITLFYATTMGEQVASKVPRGKHIIKVRAYAEIGRSQEASFELSVEDGILKCKVLS